MRYAIIGILTLSWCAAGGCDNSSSGGNAPAAKPQPAASAVNPAPAPTAPAPSTATPTSAAAPNWVVEEALYDFGTVWTGRMIIHAFTIRNDGGQPLRMSKPRAYCSCSQATSYPEVIEPGKSGQIQFSLNLQNKAGAVHETLEAQTNDPQKPSLKVTITGIARTVCEMELVEDQGILDGTTPPERATEIAKYPPNFDRVTANQKLRRVIRLKNTSGVPLVLELMPIRSAAIWDDKGKSRVVQPMFDATVNVMQEGEVYDVTVVGMPPFEPGNNITAIQFKTGIPEYPTFEIKATAYCPPRIELTPYKIVFNQQASSRQRMIKIRNNGSTPLKVTAVSVTDPNFKVTLLPIDPADPTLNQVEVLIPPDANYLPPTYGEVVRIETTDPEMGVIDIQVLPHLTNAAAPRPADKPMQFTPGKMLQ